MFLVLTFINISLGILLFGYVPETAALMIFGIGLIVSSLALRRFLRHQEARKNEEQTKETVEG